MKKKAIVFLLCLALVSVLAVNGTLASTMQGVFNTVAGILRPAPTNIPEDFNVTLVSGSTGMLTPAHYDGEDFDWDKITGAVPHTTYVRNDASQAAYVRITIAVKKKDVLRYTEPAMSTAALADYITRKKEITIEGDKYLLYTFDYTKPLAAGGTTPVISMNFALTKETTNADLEALGPKFVRVNSFAIRANDFVKNNGSMSATDALNAALGDIGDFNPYN